MRGTGLTGRVVSIAAEGMCFTIDASSNTELHEIVASLPTFMQASWEVIPLVSLEEDLLMTRAALDRFRAAAVG